MTSTILVVAALGPALTPTLLGTLMTNYTNLWFINMLMIQAILMLLVYLSLLAVSKLYVKRNFQRMIDIEIEIEP